MKNVPRFLLGVASCVLLISIYVTAAATAGATPQQAPPASPPPPASSDDPGAALLAQMCFKCHDATRVLATRRTRLEWEDTINKMIERGAQGSGKDFETVFGYLLLNHGKIYINDAGADEITKILGLSRKDADAVVAYREANGAFADADAVRKVPDIDLKTLDAHIQAVVF